MEAANDLTAEEMLQGDIDNEHGQKRAKVWKKSRTHSGRRPPKGR